MQIDFSSVYFLSFKMYRLEDNRLFFGEKEVATFPEVVPISWGDSVVITSEGETVIKREPEDLKAIWRLIEHGNVAAVVNDNGIDAHFYRDGEFQFSKQRTSYRTLNKAPFTKNGYADFLLIFHRVLLPNGEYEERFLIHGAHSELHLCSADGTILKIYQCLCLEFFCSYQTTSDKRYLVLKGWIWQPVEAGGLFDLDKIWTCDSTVDDELEPVHSSTGLSIENDEILLHGEPFSIAQIEKQARRDHILSWFLIESSLPRDLVIELSGEGRAIHAKVMWWIDQARRILLERINPGIVPTSWRDIMRNHSKLSSAIVATFGVSEDEWRQLNVAYVGGFLRLVGKSENPAVEPDLFIRCSLDELEIPDVLSKGVCLKIFREVARIRGDNFPESLY
jgi:hypothetical protein